MKRNHAAIRYAKAILEYAQEQKAEKEVQQDFQTILGLFSENPQLAAFMDSPVQEAPQKQDLIGKLLKKQATTTQKALTLLASNQRIDLLEAVAREYQTLFDLLEGSQKAVVTTAVALDKKLEKEVLEIAQKMTPQKVLLENKINPEILGGFVLQLGDLQYDASVVHQLQRIKQELIEN